MTKRKVHPHSLLSLEDCFLFAISSPADLARRLLISVEKLNEHVINKEGYKHWTNKAGRKIQEPKAELQKIHGRVHQLLARVRVPDYLQSCVTQRSYISNAQQHISEDPASRVDIKKFFQSVKRRHIYHFFYERMKCASDVSGMLANLLTCDGCLATGSRASPILAFYCFKEMFDRIANMADQKNLIVTTYVDDITLTGAVALKFEVLDEIRSVVSAYGLKSHKIRKFQHGQPRVITGVAVTRSGIRLPYRRHAKIRQGFAQLASVDSAQAQIAILNSLISRLHEAIQIEPRK